MRRILSLAVGLMVAAGVGFVIMIFWPLIAVSNSPLLQTPSGSPPPPSPASGLVRIVDTQSCAEWSTSLAGDGSYWTPVSGSLGAPGAPLCTLDANGGMSINVWDVDTDDGQGAFNTVASSVCQSMEKDGWTPGTTQ